MMYQHHTIIPLTCWAVFHHFTDVPQIFLIEYWIYLHFAYFVWTQVFYFVKDQVRSYTINIYPGKLLRTATSLPIVEGPNPWNKPDSFRFNLIVTRDFHRTERYQCAPPKNHVPTQLWKILTSLSFKKCCSKNVQMWRSMTQNETNLPKIRINWRPLNVPCPKVSALWRIARFCSRRTSRATPALWSCHLLPQI